MASKAQANNGPVEFTAQGAAMYWQGKDPRLLHILLAMEKAENWVIDGNKNAEAALREFYAKANSSDRTAHIGRMSEILLYVMANLGVPRALHMLSWLDSIAFGLGSKVVQFARSDENETKYSEVMLERLLVLRKTRVLSRVFETSRMLMVLRSLENYDEAY